MSKLKYYFVLLFSFISILPTNATHFAGSDISWRCLDTSGNYEITFKLYRDCSGITVCPPNSIGVCTIGLTISSATTGCTFTPINTTAVLTHVGPIKSINLNPNVTTICFGGSLTPGFSVYTFVGTVNLGATSSIPSTCCSVRVGYSNCCRTGIIQSGSANANFYTEAIINRCMATPVKNSSPRFLNDAIYTICSGQPIMFNMGAFDEQGDSLSYAFTPSLAGAGSSVSYSPPFSFDRPMPWSGPASGTFPAGISCNPLTGDIGFTPSASNFVGVMAVAVTEWRRNTSGIMQVMGINRRDVLCFLRVCSTNTPPTLTGANADSLPTVYNTCDQNPVCFTVVARDTNALDTTYLGWDSSMVQRGATFTPLYNASLRSSTGPRQDSFRFCWTPPAGSANIIPYRFTIHAYDNKSPVRGSITRAFTIRVSSRDTIKIVTKPDTLLLCNTIRDTLRVQFASNNGIPLFIQWYLNGVAIPGATQPTYIISSFNSSLAGNYSVKVSNPCSSDSAFIKRIQSKPKTTAQISISTNATGICPGVPASISFTALINDTINLSYANVIWSIRRQNNTVVTVGSGRTYTTSSLLSTDSVFATLQLPTEVWSCFNNTFARSNAILIPSLQVNQVVTLTANPSGQICQGDSVTFTATNSIIPDSIHYTWFVNGIQTGNNSSQFKHAPLPTHLVWVRVNATRTCLQNPSQESNKVSVGYSPATVITKTITNTNVCEGRPFTWQVSAAGIGVVYEWYKGGNLIQSNTTGLLNFAAVQAADTGMYQVRIKGKCDILPLIQGRLSLTPAAIIVSQPMPTTTACRGGRVQLSVNVSGNVIRYDWYRNGSLISGTNTPIYVIPSLSQTQLGNYHVRIITTCDTLISNIANIALEPAPTILSNPTNTQACVGNRIELVASADGTVSSYFWSRNLLPIPNSNNPTFILEAAQLTDAGQYRMNVVGLCDTTESLPAVLNVTMTPNLSTISGPTTADTFATQTYGVNQISGVAYNWQTTNGQLISGQQTNQVVVKWTSLTNTSVSVIASTVSGCADSASLAVTILNTVGLSTTSPSEVKLYPNPSTGIVYMESPYTIDEVSVFSVHGRLIANYNDLNQNYITIDKTGIYFIEIKTGNKIFREKIVIE